MLRTAEELTADDELRRLFEASGEVSDPARPFRMLHRRVAGHQGRTAYLADDRGNLLAWGETSERTPTVFGRWVSDDFRLYGRRPVGSCMCASRCWRRVGWWAR